MYRTEYVDNFTYGQDTDSVNAANRAGPGPLKSPKFDNGATQRYSGHIQTNTSHPGLLTRESQSSGPRSRGVAIHNTEFYSEQYPSIWRETIVRKDDRGKYIDPFKDVISKPYGRRLMSDPSHPEMMYGSQWSSELADVNGCYSFPTTTGLHPEMPWTKDMSWRMESEEGHWPTELWKHWSNVGLCPTYDGHTDQVEYSQYKTHVP